MRRNRFLKFPEFPGGKAEFKRYVADNLVYPKEAIENKVEGTVFLSVEIDDNGRVIDVQVKKGIGFGCDEEAVRLVKGMHYGGVHNRGLRVKTRRRMAIHFSMISKAEKKSGNSAEINPEKFQIQFDFKPTGKKEEIAAKPVYGYTINLGSEPA